MFITAENKHIYKKWYDIYQTNPDRINNSQNKDKLLQVVGLYQSYIDSVAEARNQSQGLLGQSLGGTVQALEDQAIQSQQILNNVVGIQQDTEGVIQSLQANPIPGVPPGLEEMYSKLFPGIGKTIDKPKKLTAKDIATAQNELINDLRSNPPKNYKTFIDRAFIQPLSSFMSGVQGATGNILTTLGNYSDWLEKKTGIPSGDFFSDLSKLYYENAEYYKKKGIPEGQGFASDLAKALYEGTGQFSVDLPVIASLGSWGLPIYSAITGGGEAAGAGENVGLGMIKGGLEGVALHMALKFVRYMPRGAGEMAGGAIFGGLTLQEELNKPEEDVDWSNVVAQTLLGIGLTMQGRRVSQKDFLNNIKTEFKNGRKSFLFWTKEKGIPKQNAERLYNELKTVVELATEGKSPEKTVYQGGKGEVIGEKVKPGKVVHLQGARERITNKINFIANKMETLKKKGETNTEIFDDLQRQIDDLVLKLNTEIETPKIEVQRQGERKAVTREEGEGGEPPKPVKPKTVEKPVVKPVEKPVTKQTATDLSNKIAADILADLKKVIKPENKESDVSGLVSKDLEMKFAERVAPLAKSNPELYNELVGKKDAILKEAERIAKEDIKEQFEGISKKEEVKTETGEKESWEMTRDESVEFWLNRNFYPKGENWHRIQANGTVVEEPMSNKALKSHIDNFIGAHKEAVNQALLKGKPVPESVLKDYPDLARPETPTTPIKTSESGVKIFRVKIKDLFTDLKMFQNRTKAYSEEKVVEIVKNYDERKMEPIDVWVNPEDGKTYVIEGHSRMEALNRLNIEDIDIRYFEGTKKEAIEFAETKNDSKATHTLIDKAKILNKRIRRDGLSNSQAREEAKNLYGKNANTVFALSKLDPNGKAMQTLKSFEKTDDVSHQDVITMAKWVGEIRNKYPELTKSHENEIFDNLIENFRKTEKYKSSLSFMAYIDQAIARNTFMGKFDAEKPINLKGLRSLTPSEVQYNENLNEASKNLNKAKKDLDKRRDELLQRKKGGEDISTEDINRELKRYENDVQFYQKELIDLRMQETDIQRQAKREIGLFDQIEKTTEQLEKEGISHEQIKKHESKYEDVTETKGEEGLTGKGVGKEKEAEQSQKKLTLASEAKGEQGGIARNLSQRLANLYANLDAIKNKTGEYENMPEPRRQAQLDIVRDLIQSTRAEAESNGIELPMFLGIPTPKMLKDMSKFWRDKFKGRNPFPPEKINEMRTAYQLAQERESSLAADDVSKRTNWTPETEKIDQHSQIKNVRNHPEFNEAKTGGDAISGYNVAKQFIKPERIELLKQKYEGKKVIILPVNAVEAGGKNKIPQGTAIYIQELTGWEIDNNILQKNIVERTGESAEYRRKNIPEFDGEVDPNAIYIIVDDVVTSGGTLAQLKGHIENNGGSVGKMITLGGAQFSTKMKPTPEAIQKLKNLYGNKLGKVLNYVYGKGTKPEQLTQSEAKHLGSKKVYNQILDEIRNEGISEGTERGLQKGSGIHPKPEEFIESKTQETSGTPIPAKGKPGETYAGAINLTKYPKETRPIIEAVVNQLGKGAVEEARGRRKVSDTRALASKPKKVAEMVVKALRGEIKPGEALNEVDLDALRVGGQALSDHLLKNYKNMDNAQLNEYTKQLGLIETALTSGSSTAGRTLRQLQEPVTSELNLKYLKQAKKDAIKDGDTAWANHIEKEIQNVIDHNPTWVSKFVELRRNMLLAAGSSLVRAGIGNPINTAWFTAEIPISAAFNTVYTNLAKGLRKAVGREPIDQRTRYQEEFVYHLIGTAKGIRPASKNAWKMLKGDQEVITGDPLYEMGAWREVGAILGTKGKVIRTPQRAQGAIDIMYREPITTGFVYRFAVRKALQEKLRGQEKLDRIKDIIENPTDAMLKEAAEEAREYTFQKELGFIAESFNKLRKGKMEGTQAIIPFYGTFVNIGKLIYKRSPLGVLTPTTGLGLKQGLKYGDWGKLSDHSAMVASGTLAILALNKIYEIGLIDNIQDSWSDKTEQERKLLRAQNKQPNSVEVFNDDGTLKYSWSFEGYEPLSSYLRLVGAMQQGKRLNERDLEILKRATVSLVRDFKENPMLQGIDELFALSSGKIDGMSYATRFLKSSSIPNFIYQTRGVIDPHYTATPHRPEELRDWVDPKQWWRRIQREFPGLTKNVYKDVDILGNPIPIPSPEKRMFAVSIAHEVSDKQKALILLEFERLNLGNMRWTADYKDIKLTEEEKMRLKISSGELFTKIMKSVMFDQNNTVKDSFGNEHTAFDKDGVIQFTTSDKLKKDWKTIPNVEQEKIIREMKNLVSDIQKKILFPDMIGFDAAWDMKLYDEVGTPQKSPAERKREKTEAYRKEQ